MVPKFKSLKKQLKSLEQSDASDYGVSRKKSGSIRKNKVVKTTRYLLFVAFLITFLSYAVVQYGIDEQVTSPVPDFFSWVDQPSESLLEDMGTWMEDMGYTGLSREDLIDLREQGVTATFTSRMRDLGYTDLTLDDLVRLRQNEVTATFSAMMKELGYELTPEELIQLRQHNVTAYYTSNMHDLGYTDLTKEELIRLKDTGVQLSEVQRLVEQNEERPSVEELIRYHISNQ